MNRTHTMIVALALTVDDDSSLPAFESVLEGKAQHVSVVGVLDREHPVNNFEPQIFAAWPEEQKGREHAA